MIFYVSYFFCNQIIFYAFRFWCIHIALYLYQFIFLELYFQRLWLFGSEKVKLDKSADWLSSSLIRTADLQWKFSTSEVVGHISKLIAALTATRLLNLWPPPCSDRPKWLLVGYSGKITKSHFRWGRNFIRHLGVGWLSNQTRKNKNGSW